MRPFGERLVGLCHRCGRRRDPAATETRGAARGSCARFRLSPRVRPGRPPSASFDCPRRPINSNFARSPVRCVGEEPAVGGATQCWQMTQRFRKRRHGSPARPSLPSAPLRRCQFRLARYALTVPGWAAVGDTGPEPRYPFGIPVDFILFALTLLGVAVFHHHTLPVALTGLPSLPPTNWPSRASSSATAGRVSPAIWRTNG